METEYMSEFRRIYTTDSVRKSFRDKVEYRQSRRKRENEHHWVLQEDDDYPQRPRSADLDNVLERIPSDIPASTGHPHIPTLDLRPTPSPTSRPETLSSSGVGSQNIDSVLERGNSPKPASRHHVLQRSPSPQRHLSHSCATQTSGRHNETSCEFAKEQARTKSKGIVIDHRSGALPRRRSRSPFAPFAIGDRERGISEKRTFNIKASNGGQIYETAIRAASRKGYPLPQKSRKAVMLDIRRPHKESHSKRHMFDHGDITRKNVAFDY